MGVNKVILLGNLGKDPEVRVFESGTKKASFSMATAESFTDKNGEKKERTEWHNVIFWGKIAEVIEKYLKKGSQVYIEGRIAQRSYDDKDGVKRYITEIEGVSLVILNSKQAEEKPAAAQPSTATDEGDDLPF